SMNMEAATDAQNINIELTVASPRSVDLLFSQLSKLVDVAHVATRKSSIRRKARWWLICIRYLRPDS
ncbi:acetolactate synthase 2 small subunit, partial [Salmonella enterica subsp. enterica serovar Kentucky]|nr:acetolactate synthase 2 small subunit [Salmonella enterica subsp. enterica serovar Kentucky]